MKRIFPGILAVFLLLISQPVFAASVTLRAGTVEGATGSTVEIPIEVAGAAGLGALQWEVVFDPTVLSADTVTQGKQASKALVESRKDTPGRLFIALASSEDVNGDGPVAVAKFKVIGAQGQSSNLAIENANAWEGKTLRAVQVNPAAGKFTIGGLPWWLPWLLLALGILLLLLILILLLTRRRKPKAAVAAPYPQMQPPPMYYPQGQQPPMQRPYMSPEPPPMSQGQPLQMQRPYIPPGQGQPPPMQRPPGQQPPMPPGQQPPMQRPPGQTGQMPQGQQPPMQHPPGQPQGQQPPQGSAVYCRNCGTPNAPGSPSCRNCRVPLA